jgi:hypothetical protein
MSSYITVSERALATEALRRQQAQGLSVLVGGFGVPVSYLNDLVDEELDHLDAKFRCQIRSISLS